MATNESITSQRKRTWTWIWLGYTGFLFIEPIVSPSANLWLGTLTVFAAFVGIFVGYVRAMDQGKKAGFWFIGATMLLGLISFPWNQGASTFFVYTAAFLPFTLSSTKRVLWLFLLECLVIVGEGSLFHLVRFPAPFHTDWVNTIVAVLLVLVIGGGNIFFAEQRRAECKLRAAQDENLALAALAERERIARDLHDVLGHTLSVIVLKAELAGRLISIDPERSKTEISDVERISRTALAEVREAIGGYRARGLAAEIDAARLTLDAAGVRLIAENDQAPPAALNPQEETALALALREAVTNIVRHSKATTCHLRFIAMSGHRRLVVEDDGHHAATREGNGLRGMRERIESLGGHLQMERGFEHSRGTRLTIDLPLREAAAS